MKSVEIYVSAAGNGFMTDIAHWVADAARQAGREVSVITDRLPSDPDVANLVIAPHEFFALLRATDAMVNRAAAISVPICTEQPGTPWFEIGASYCRPAPFTLDINQHGVEGLRRLGLPAERLILGGSPLLVAPSTARDIDVLFLGADTPRRRARLATLAPGLADRRSEIRLFDFRVPVDDSTPGIALADEKYDLLARSLILVNIHRDDKSPGYFEWARLVEAMANGCTVVTEPCSGFEPLVAGTHFVEAADPAAAVADLLADPERRAAIAKAGATAVLDELPLVDSLKPVLDRIDGLDLRNRTERERARIGRNRIRHAATSQLFPPFRPASAMRQRVYQALLDEQKLRRRIERARCILRFGVPGRITEHASPAYLESFADGEVPEMSVIVTLYNYAPLVTETLDSVLASRDVDLELILVDDHSSDDGRAVVRRYMDDHPGVPMLLLGREENGGLVAARNLGIERSRADRIMMMDADNLVFPACLRRLSDALDADPTASFAYSILEAFGSEPGLRSHMAWSPAWLCIANYIDAQALVRRSTFERHGGYHEDEAVYGWEDWDLWLRLAAAGEHGAFVPEMLGRYRTQPSSMVSVTNLASDFLRQRVEARYPDLPWPAL